MVKRKSEREKIQDQAQKRRERIISLYNNEMKIKDIAESEGVSTTTITRDITQLVKAGKVKRKKPFKEKRYQEMEERRERIIPLYDNGMSIKDIAEIEGVSMTTIAKDIKQLMKAGRVKKQGTLKENHHQEIEERRERIISLYNKGMRIKDIAEIEGVSMPTISKDIKRLVKAGKVKKRKTLNEKQHQEVEDNEELMAKFERRTIWAVLRDKIESGNRKAIESYIDKILEVRPKSFSKEDFELILKYKNVISFAKTGMEKSDRETLMEEKKNQLDNEEER